MTAPLLEARHVTKVFGGGLFDRQRVVALEDGRQLPWDRLLIATGGRPRRLQWSGRAAAARRRWPGCFWG